MRGKNILWLSLVAILVGTLALVPVGKSPANTKLFIDPARIPAPGLTGHVGDAYVLTVNVQDVSDLWTVGFKIRFAPYVSVMVISELYEGSFLSEGGFWPTFYTYSIDAFHGTADVAILRLPNPEFPDMRIGASGSGALMSFKLTIVEAGEYPISLEDSIMIDTTGAEMSHKATGSHYYGSTADLIRIEMLPSKQVYVGETINLKSRVRNDGDVPLYVKVRLNIERAEDGRMIIVRAGQTYFDGGLGEDPPMWIDYLYVNGFTGHYGEGWGWNYVGTAPYLNAVGDGSYIWSDGTGMEDASLPGFYPYTGRYDFDDFTLADPDRVIDNVIIEAYTQYAWGLDEENDLDTYMREPWTQAGGSKWLGSLWGTDAAGWHTVRWTTSRVSDIFPQVKDPYQLSGARVRFVLYWTADDLPHGRVDVDAMRLKVTQIPKEWGMSPATAPYFVVMPGQELELSVITWKAKNSHIGTYSATATVEYTSNFFKWNSWATKQQTFKFQILP